MQDYERKGGIHSKVNTKEFEENYEKIFNTCANTIKKNLEKATAEIMKKPHEDKCPCTNADKDCKDEDYSRCCAE